VPPEGVVQELRLHDGSRLYGRVEAVEQDTVLFRTTGGVEVRVPRADVRSVTRVQGRVVDGVFFRADPNATRLLFGPTARAPARGSGYLGVFEIVMPFVQVGVTDRFSIGGGTPLIFGVFDSRPVWITPKLQIVGAERTQVAVGLMHVFNLEDASGGIAYTVVTWGGSDAAITAGAGLGYGRDPHSPTEYAGVAMIGGERQVARSIKLLTENYVWRGSGILSGGIRFFGERLSADLGLFVPLVGEDFVALPIVNFTWWF
jgi:hypothetical protein